MQTNSVLVQTSSEETGPRSSSPLIVSRDSFSPWTWASRRAEHSHSSGCLYIFLIYCFYYLTCLCNNFYGLSALVGCWSSVFIRRMFKCVSFGLHGFCGYWEGWDPVNRFNHTSSLVAIVTSTDHPKSVRNRCVIEVFGGVFVLSRCFSDFSVGVGAFVIGLSQISSFFTYIYAKATNNT